MTIVKSQSFCGGQNGLTILAKTFFKSLKNIFDHLVRPFSPILFWVSFEFFVATIVNGRQLLLHLLIEYVLDQFNIDESNLAS